MKSPKIAKAISSWPDASDDLRLLRTSPFLLSRNETAAAVANPLAAHSPSNLTRPMIRSCVRDNILLLDQGGALISALDERHYREPVAACFGSSVGGHTRHVVEHYDGFFAGLGASEIDYEARPRDLSVELDRAVALARLQRAVDRLEKLGEDSDRPVRVRAETAPAESAFPWAHSSLLRELELLLSHTVHHYALIAITCRLVGFEPPPDFGVAPSTLRHRQTLGAACAR